MLGRKKVGLALSGGGIRGLAHIGVLKVLEDYNIPIDMISGTSMGALIGALYAAEPNAKKLEKEVLSEDIKKLIDYTFSKHGIIKGVKLEEYLQKRLNNISFKDLKMPLYITAFDVEKKREVIFHKGDVAKAVRASVSVPGIFIPVENNGEILVDAGIIDPVPTEVLKKFGADIIIAVNVNNIRERKPVFNDVATKQKSSKKLPSMFDTAMLAMNIEGAEVAKADVERDKPDFLINLYLEDITLFDYKKSKKAIDRGKRTALKSLQELKRITNPNPFKSFLDELNIKLDVKKFVRKVKKSLEEN